jgi:hypothetical protein
MEHGIKYLVAASVAGVFMVAAYYFPAETFLAFIAGWLFLIPAAFIVYMVYGLMEYMKDREHRIEVAIKPTEVMRAIARGKEELKREQERILYEEMSSKPNK